MNNTEITDYAVPKNNKGALALVFGLLSLVTSILSIGFIFGVIGLIVGVLGLKQIKKYNQQGKGKAVAGIVCSLVGIIISISFSLTAGNLLLN